MACSSSFCYGQNICIDTYWKKHSDGFVTFELDEFVTTLISNSNEHKWLFLILSNYNLNGTIIFRFNFKNLNNEKKLKQMMKDLDKKKRKTENLLWLGYRRFLQTTNHEPLQCNFHFAKCNTYNTYSHTIMLFELETQHVKKRNAGILLHCAQFFSPKTNYSNTKRWQFLTRLSIYRNMQNPL